MSNAYLLGNFSKTELGRYTGQAKENSQMIKWMRQLSCTEAQSQGRKHTKKGAIGSGEPLSGEERKLSSKF